MCEPAALRPASARPPLSATTGFARDSRRATGNFYIDETVLREEGITDFEQYAVTPGAALYSDLFLD